MILDFADAKTEAFYEDATRPRAGRQSVLPMAARKLDMLEAAATMRGEDAPS